jgi:AMP phosphorylase
MKLKVKIFELLAGRPIAILNHNTANKINVHIGERILVSKFGDNIISIVDVSKDFLKTDEIALSREILDALSLREGDDVEVGLAEKPESTLYIKRKIDGEHLTKKEIETIVKDIVNNALTEAEIAYFVAAVYKNGMNNEEIENLIWCMVATGKRLQFQGQVVDKHSIGGIAANRTTPIIVSICAAAGLVMPKTSSRAITSAAGTADVVESIAGVEFSTEQIKRIVEKTNACMVWGGSLGLSPADDKLIQIERVINVDPEAQLLASVLSKKISVGSKHVLIDIPYGKSAKVDKKKGLDLKKKFEFFGKKFGLNIKCVLTRGDEPIGKGIGPLLEIRDIIKVLKKEKDAPQDLKEKALILAGEIFELSGKTKNGKGKKLAEEILESGKALQKFKEIIEAQDGKVPTLEEINKKMGKFKKDLLAEKSGKIREIDNKKINFLGHIAGSPMDKGAGLYLYHHIGSKVSKNDKLLTIYADSQTRLKEAIDNYNKNPPIIY